MVVIKSLKKFAIILMLVMVAGLHASLAIAELQLKYDRFRNTTTISTKTNFKNKQQQPYFGVSAAYRGEGKPKTPFICLISFISPSKKPEYIDCHPVYFLIDGQPFNLGSFQYDSKVVKEDVLEFIYSYHVSFETLKTFSSASKIEVKICNTEFILKEWEMNDLRDLVSRFE